MNQFKIRVIDEKSRDTTAVTEFLENMDEVNVQVAEPFATYTRDSRLKSAVFTLESENEPDEVHQKIHEYIRDNFGLTERTVIEVYN